MAAPKVVRLRNTATGVVVEVREDKVERLARGWAPDDGEKKAAPARRSSPAKSDK